jgi:alanyl-tRNA synthetase
MQTERLYYEDPYLTTFSARVIAAGTLGSHAAVALDRTAFYPEGGGQPADWGTLGEVRVVDVQVVGDTLWHAVERMPATEVVAGTVDWGRRFDHMQQHHGQHLLSAAFERLFGFRTVSFHLSPATATIDIAATSLSDEHAAAAEDLTNQVIWEDRPVHARFVTAQELAAIPLRKAPVVEGPVRVVSVPDFDHSACGGTHPRSTGGGGIVHLRKWERRGGDMRVEFVCGRRAALDLRMKNRLVARVSGALTVGADELEGAVARVRESDQESRKRLEGLVERLAEYEAAHLMAGAARAGDLVVVRGVYRDRTLQDLKVLANQVAARGGVALLGLGADRAQLVFASPAGSAVDCGKLLRECVGPFGGKGGGQASLAQGGIPDVAKLDSVLDAAVAAVSR